MNRRDLLRGRPRRSAVETSFDAAAQAPSSGTRADYWIRVHRRAMACRFEITLAGEDAGHVAAAQADALSTTFLVGGLDLAERYCASHPRTLALVTPDDGSERPCVLGGHPGASLEEA